MPDPSDDGETRRSKNDVETIAEQPAEPKETAIRAQGHKRSRGEHSKEGAHVPDKRRRAEDDLL